MQLTAWPGPVRRASLVRFARRLRGDASGLALVEFGLAAPILLALGTYGIETANLAITHMKVSQIALTLADNSSRVGESSPLALKKLRESDINDALQAVRVQGAGIELTTRGRVTLSSLQRNADGGQWIKWQRCVGLKPYNSTYGVTNDGQTGTSLLGMGASTNRIAAPPGGAVMFVEIRYDYKPIVSSTLLGTPRIEYTAAFIVRDQRDLTQIYNSGNATPVSACSAYTV